MSVGLQLRSGCKTRMYCNARITNYQLRIAAHAAWRTLVLHLRSSDTKQKCGVRQLDSTIRATRSSRDDYARAIASRRLRSRLAITGTPAHNHPIFGLRINATESSIGLRLNETGLNLKCNQRTIIQFSPLYLQITWNLCHHARRKCLYQ